MYVYVYVYIYIERERDEGELRSASQLGRPVAGKRVTLKLKKKQGGDAKSHEPGYIYIYIYI